MRWAVSASDRIAGSVRPAIGIPRKASAMPKRSSKARDIARPPAPPVSTRVPSMSKRMSLWFESAFAANVAGARPFGRRLFFELDALAFIQLIEAALHRAPVKEPLLTAVVANEPKSPVPNESLDRAA